MTDQKSSLDSFLLPTPKQKRSTPRKAPWERHLLDAQLRSKSGEWEDAPETSFLGLYTLFFDMVYKMYPIEVKNSKTYKIAKINFKRIFTNYFNEDECEIVEFMKWSWMKEQRRNEWAKQQNIDVSPMSILKQFSEKLVQEYFVNRRG